MPVRTRRGRSVASLLGVLAALMLCAIPPLAAGAVRPSLFRIELQPTALAPGAQAVVRLAPARSPFGLALTPDGHVIFDVELTASGLPAPSSFGPYTQYVAWAVTSDLTVAERLGVAGTGQAVSGQVAFNKFLIVVTAEGATVGNKWQGPIILRGFSPSALLENFSGKTMFNGGMPQ